MNYFKTIYLFIILTTVGCKIKNTTNHLYNGAFEGSEPFWSFEITNNKYTIYCDNNKTSGTIEFSKVSERGSSFAFIDKRNDVYGIINKSNNSCDLAITDTDSLEYEIYFNFMNATYKGCGSIK